MHVDTTYYIDTQHPKIRLTVLVYLKEPMKSISLKTVCMVGTQHFSAPRPTSTIRPPGATASRAVCNTQQVAVQVLFYRMHSIRKGVQPVVLPGHSSLDSNHKVAFCSQVVFASVLSLHVGGHAE